MPYSRYRRRTPRRAYRRRYSRYPMRRYRSPQLNDAERRTMSFVQNMVVDITVPRQCWVYCFYSAPEHPFWYAYWYWECGSWFWPGVPCWLYV